MTFCPSFNPGLIAQNIYNWPVTYDIYSWPATLNIYNWPVIHLDFLLFLLNLPCVRIFPKMLVARKMKKKKKCQLRTCISKHGQGSRKAREAIAHHFPSGPHAYSDNKMEADYHEEWTDPEMSWTLALHQQILAVYFLAFGGWWWVSVSLSCTGDQATFDAVETQRKSHTQAISAAPSPLKQMATVFWYYPGVVFTDWLLQGMTTNNAYYCQSLRSLRRRIQQQRKGKWSRHLLLLHDSARPHTSCETVSELEYLGWTVLPHPPYSPDRAPNDCLMLWRSRWDAKD